ncbi:hypothetical protein UFOVP1290_80 [uncultured Caudovirales phage]|uniref:Uncharacterized protein n=1 Tax=uncultured Caudovirales phage TaxID=2100421 RepID=A0A6J5RG77_9CAUD|nr:hypothetical protein UFOVP1290_80 [uncultured Caudovirales phage]
MKKSLTKIYFNVKDVLPWDLLKIDWRTATVDQKPNDWSVRVIFQESSQYDNPAIAEIQFLFPEANYLLVPGTKFKLFHSKIDIYAEMIKEI